MTKIRIVLTLVFSFLVLVSSSHSWEGKIVEITDGDTVVCLDRNNEQTKIRLFGIDAPEKKKKQAFWNKSRQFLGNLVFGKIVDVSVVGTDRYGRTIARIFYQGKDAGLLSIQNGFAWHYKKYAPHETAYAEAQERARKNRLGLWIDADPIPPWEFRKSKKTKK